MVRGSLILGEECLSGSRSYRAFDPFKNSFCSDDFVEVERVDLERLNQELPNSASAYAAVSADVRLAFLNAVADEIEAQAEALVETAMQETGLGKQRLQTELKRTCYQLMAYALAGKEALLSTTTSHDTSVRLTKKWIPLGTVLVFGASNFPFAYSTLGGDTAAALAAACPVVVKAHPAHPLTNQRMATLFSSVAEEWKMPKGIFNLVQATDEEILHELINLPASKAIGFTGSKKVGLSIVKKAQMRVQPIPVYAEMGSVNPVIVLPEAAQFEISEKCARFVRSMTDSAGQFCTNPGVLFLPSEAVEKWIEELTTLLENVPPQVMLSPGIKAMYVKQAAIVASDGVENRFVHVPETGCEAPILLRSCMASYFLENANSCQTEVFGMHTLIVCYETIQQLKDALVRLEGQLTGSVFFSEEEKFVADDVVAVLAQKVGRIIVNGLPTGVRVVPEMHHGGPFPATNDVRFTAVGEEAVQRFLRPLCIQEEA